MKSINKKHTTRIRNIFIELKECVYTFWAMGVTKILCLRIEHTNQWFFLYQISKIYTITINKPRENCKFVWLFANVSIRNIYKNLGLCLKIMYYSGHVQKGKSKYPLIQFYLKLFSISHTSHSCSMLQCVKYTQWMDKASRLASKPPEWIDHWSFRSHSPFLFVYLSTF